MNYASLFHSPEPATPAHTFFQSCDTIKTIPVSYIKKFKQNKPITFKT